MSDLDTIVRTGLEAASAGVGEVAPTQLADRLTVVRARRARSRQRRVLAGLAVLALTVAAAVVVTRGDGQQGGAVSTGPTLADGPGFEILAPGWHVLDPGPVPAMSQAALGWTGHELVVAGDGVAFAYQPGTGAWRELPAPPVGERGAVGFAWTGDLLVAVTGGADSGRSATWDPETDTWTPLAPIPSNPELVRTGVTGPHLRSGGAALVWTGSRVLDLTHGAVLDPSTGGWSALALPDDLVPYTPLVNSLPVRVGDEVVLTSWSSSRGLAWDALGSTYHEVPGLPLDVIGPRPDVSSDSVPTAIAGGVMLVNGDGLSARFDVPTGTWSALPPVPGMGTGEGCPSSIATVAGEVVVAPCDGRAPVVLRGGAWVPIGEPPGAGPCCTMISWLDAGGALVTWSTSTDTSNGPPEPYRSAAVWVP